MLSTLTLQNNETQTEIACLQRNHKKKCSYKRNYRSNLDFNQVDRLLDRWPGRQLTSIQDSSGRWDDLTAASVNGISMQCDVMDVEPHATQVLFAQYTLQTNNNHNILITYRVYTPFTDCKAITDTRIVRSLQSRVYGKTCCERTC